MLWTLVDLVCRWGLLATNDGRRRANFSNHQSQVDDGRSWLSSEQLLWPASLQHRRATNDCHRQRDDNHNNNNNGDISNANMKKN